MIPQPNRPRSNMHPSSSLQLDRPQNLPLHSSWNTLPLGSQVKFMSFRIFELCMEQNFKNCIWRGLPLYYICTKITKKKEVKIM